MDAVFRCQHQTADIVSWIVNGSSRRDFPDDIIPASTSDHDGSLVYTLTIPAKSEYNGTEIVCMAVFLSDPGDNEETPPVTLTVIDGTLFKRFVDFLRAAIV